MRKLNLLLVLIFVHLISSAQNYPFQDTRLSEDERIRNLISLMTQDEKINCLSTRLSIPRLGIKGTRTVEGLHGLAYSGPANWAVKGAKASPTTTFPQAISLEQEDLVKLVLAANPKTVLIMVSSFPYAINWSKEHVPAILHISQSSQELGNAMADVVFGKISPAGRLVQTWLSSIDQLPPILNYNIRNGRTYMYNKNIPLFPFGYGLTYTSFKYSGLKPDKNALRNNEVINLTFNLQNTGNFDSDEVVQLYVSFPDSMVERPGIALKGFKRIFVRKGETVKVTIPVKASDLTYWDTDKKAFVLEQGKVRYFIGSSSDDFKLHGEITVN